MNLLNSHEEFFNDVCKNLGSKWRLDLKNSDRFRVSIFNPEIKHYSVNFRVEDKRFIITDNIKPPLKSFKSPNRCTAAMTRKPKSLARDLERKIIFDSSIKLKEANDYLKGLRLEKENKDIIKGVINNLVSVSGHYSKICSFNHRKNRKISGTVDGYVKQDSYKLELTNLNQDQLIRIIAAVSGLEV